MRANAPSWLLCAKRIAKSRWNATSWQRLAHLVCKQQRNSVHVIYTLIAANQAELPVATMCNVLNVSKSGYYDWHERAPSKRMLANAKLLDQIKQAHALSDETYGMPRIRAELADAGVIASRKRIAALMRANGIAGVSRRRGYCVTTVRNPRDRPAPDLVKRQFIATDINQLWVADMTYVPTWQSFLYLAVVTDVFSRKVVGWAFGARQTADLVVTALNMALFTRKPESVIHHSDQGSQRASDLWQALRRNEGAPQYGHGGRCLRQRDGRELLCDAGVRADRQALMEDAHRSKARHLHVD
jgi:hypothetical protein